MRTYFCDCGGSTDVAPKKITKCKCGKVFGMTKKISNYINMRSTWSGQTKVEFSQKTIDEDIAERNAR